MHHWFLCEMHLFENRQKLPTYANHPNVHTHACPCVCLYRHKHTRAYTHKHTPLTVTWFTFNPLQDTESSVTGEIYHYKVSLMPQPQWFRPEGLHSDIEVKVGSLSLGGNSIENQIQFCNLKHSTETQPVILNLGRT